MAEVRREFEFSRGMARREAAREKRREPGRESRKERVAERVRTGVRTREQIRGRGFRGFLRRRGKELGEERERQKRGARERVKEEGSRETGEPGSEKSMRAGRELIREERAAGRMLPAKGSPKREKVRIQEAILERFGPARKQGTRLNPSGQVIRRRTKRRPLRRGEMPTGRRRGER